MAERLQKGTPFDVDFHRFALRYPVLQSPVCERRLAAR
jgi:hypothetical protein